MQIAAEWAVEDAACFDVDNWASGKHWHFAAGAAVGRRPTFELRCAYEEQPTRNQKKWSQWIRLADSHLPTQRAEGMKWSGRGEGNELTEQNS